MNAVRSMATRGMISTSSSEAMSSSSAGVTDVRREGGNAMLFFFGIIGDFYTEALEGGDWSSIRRSWLWAWWPSGRECCDGVTRRANTPSRVADASGSFPTVCASDSAEYLRSDFALPQPTTLHPVVSLFTGWALL